MGNYIRKPAVFNPESERERRIWNWIETSTNNFSKQNFAAFVRDKLEWCMQNENSNSLGPMVAVQSRLSEEVQKKKGWSNLI